MELRREPRRQLELCVSINGRNKIGELFAQNAIASSVSACGALISGIGPEMRSGDLIWVEYAKKRARFRIVWVRNSQSQQLIQAAVQLLDGEESPWNGV